MTALGTDVPAGKCPTGCGRQQPRGKMMCLTCWREVPKHLQNDVYRTWRAYQKAHGYAALTKAGAAYRAAREAALASIR